MKYIVFFLLFLFFSCGKEKSVQLPQVTHFDIQKIDKGSKTYLKFDKTKNNAIEFSEKKLKTSSNWLFYIDRRITLKQLIPATIKLQEAKRNQKEISESISKNYYACDNTSLKKSGFLDFTDVVYHNGIDRNIVEDQTLYKMVPSDEINHILSVLFKANDSITINSANTTKAKFIERLQYMDSIQDKITGIIYLKFNQNLTFQEYITYKSMLSKLKLKHATISDDEYIFN